MTRFSNKLATGAIAALALSTSTAFAIPNAEAFALASPQGEDPTVACHNICGPMILAGRACAEDDNECLCAPDSQFGSGIGPCLECGALLWNIYGRFLTPFLERCNLPTTPVGWVAPSTPAPDSASESTPSATEPSSTTPEPSSTTPEPSSTSEPSSTPEPSSTTPEPSSSSEPSSTTPEPSTTTPEPSSEASSVESSTAPSTTAALDPTVQCHNICGPMILAGRACAEDDNECLCAPDSPFGSGIGPCLECGALLWNIYGRFLTPFLQRCNLPTTPVGWVAPSTTAPGSASESTPSATEPSSTTPEPSSSSEPSSTTPEPSSTTPEPSSSSEPSSTTPEPSSEASSVESSTAPSTTAALDPTVQCHNICGPMIVAGRACAEDDNECLCAPDSPFGSGIGACLECGSLLWNIYGRFLTPFLQRCNLPTTPVGWVAPSTPAPTSATEPISSPEPTSAPASSSEEPSSVESSTAPSTTAALDPTVQCHNICGPMILAGRACAEDDNECLCAPDSPFGSGIGACLECGSLLWNIYGRFLTPFLQRCNLPTTPVGWGVSSTSAPISASEPSSAPAITSDEPSSVSQSTSAPSTTSDLDPKTQCHNICGPMILAGRACAEDDNECLCAPDSPFGSGIGACLECGSLLWNIYGRFLTPFLQRCNLPTTPVGWPGASSTPAPGSSGLPASSISNSTVTSISTGIAGTSIPTSDVSSGIAGTGIPTSGASSGIAGTGVPTSGASSGIAGTGVPTSASSGIAGTGVPTSGASSGIAGTGIPTSGVSSGASGITSAPVVTSSATDVPNTTYTTTITVCDDKACVTKTTTVTEPCTTATDAPLTTYTTTVTVCDDKACVTKTTTVTEPCETTTVSMTTKTSTVTVCDENKCDTKTVTVTEPCETTTVPPNVTKSTTLTHTTEITTTKTITTCNPDCTETPVVETITTTICETVPVTEAPPAETKPSKPESHAPPAETKPSKPESHAPPAKTVTVCEDGKCSTSVSHPPAESHPSKPTSPESHAPPAHTETVPVCDDCSSTTQVTIYSTLTKSIPAPSAPPAASSSVPPVAPPPAASSSVPPVAPVPSSPSSPLEQVNGANILSASSALIVAVFMTFLF